MGPWVVGRPLARHHPQLAFWPFLLSLDRKSQPRLWGAGGGQSELRAHTHQGCHPGDPHGQGVALLQHLLCGPEGVLREGVGQVPHPAHEAPIGLGRLPGLLASRSGGWGGEAGRRESGSEGRESQAGLGLAQLHRLTVTWGTPSSCLQMGTSETSGASPAPEQGLGEPLPTLLISRRQLTPQGGMGSPAGRYLTRPWLEG